jgi:excisionase family DNA binding protein
MDTIIRNGVKKVWLMEIKELNDRRTKLSYQPFISVNSIANYCMVSRTTVDRWIHDGKLPAMRLPSGHFRVTLNDFKEFLRRNDMPISKELRNF